MNLVLKPGLVSGLVALSIVGVMLAPPTLALAPNLSPLTFLPGDDVIAPAAGLQEEPSIAAGGSGYLAVWSDARSSAISLPSFSAGPYFSPGIGTMRDIYAIRLDASGHPIDATPIIVELNVLNQGSPDVSWNGENWLVVWMGQAGLACCPQVNIYAARVSPSGQVLDNPPIVVDTDATTSGLYWPTVTSDSSNWVVVWRDLDSQAGIFTLDGTRISAAGAILDPGGKQLRHDSFNSYPIGPSIAFAGDEYLLVWNEDSNEVAAQRLDLALNPVGAVFRVNTGAGSNGKNPSVASNGTSFFVAWFEDRFSGWAQLAGTRVSHQGQVLDAAGIAITPANGYTQFTPTVAWDGVRWAVAYNFQVVGFDEDLYLTHVSTAGVVLDPNGIEVAGGPAQQSLPRIAPTPSGGIQLVWQASGGTPALDGDILGAVVTSSGAVGTPAYLSIGAPRQTKPEFVWNGSGYLAVFLSQTGNEARLLGQRIDAEGVPLDNEPFVIASGDPLFSGPSAAWDGTRYLVAWSTSQSQIEARRLAADGTRLDVAPIAVMPGNIPDVAVLNGVFLVAGTFAQNPEFRYPYTTRIRGTDGAKLDASPVLIGSYFATNVDARAVGNRWLVAWQQNPTHDNVRSDIVANFVGSNGVPETPFNLTSTSITIEVDPFVSAGPDNALVGWSNGDLLARRVAAEGGILDAAPIVLSSAPGGQLQPEAAWDGKEHVVDFTDQRQDDANGPYVGDVFALRMTGSGALLDPEGFAIASDITVPELDPAVDGGNAQAALGCAAFVPASPFESYRIAYRILNPLSTTDVEPWIPSHTLAATPNPFGKAITFAFRSGASGRAQLDIYDVSGRLVQTLETVLVTGAEAHIIWDGLDRAGVRRPPGIYFARLVTPEGQRLAKIVRR
jgi:hypothetical protein